jgi:hypothetical protein
MPIAAMMNVLRPQEPPMEAICDDDWKEIAEAARKEQDPEKLMRLVQELNKILEERQLRNAGSDQTPHKSSS